MYLGIDLGIAAVKAILVDDDQRIVAQAEHPLALSRPQPSWSEQDPEDWWEAACAAIADLRRDHSGELSGVAGIGLAGSMHGITLLDGANRPLRPAILWPDDRAAEDCAELERREPRTRVITGNRAAPCFAAPKLLWVARREPEIFGSIARILPPKDYLRLRLTGSHATDTSDAAGTLWLDVGRRQWSETMLTATGLSRTQMPELYEGPEATGKVDPEIARDWGIPASAVVAGGAAEYAAEALGTGVIEPGLAMLSLGGSGVMFAATPGFAPSPEHGLHALCHCLPEIWSRMAVMLSTTSCLDWLARLTGGPNAAALLAEAGQADRDIGGLIFLPYLAGERTPHDDPAAKGVFFGLSHDTSRADLTRAVLEGVAFACADSQAALADAGTPIDEVMVTGGGARSPFWGRILAAALNRPLSYPKAGSNGAAFGAARLARLAASGEDPAAVCVRAPVEFVAQPNPVLASRYAEKWQRYRRLYQSLRPLFAETARS